MATSSSFSSTAAATATATDVLDSTQSLLKLMRGHEVSIAELSALSSSRTVYQKNGNIFFRTSVQQATASEKSKIVSNSLCSNLIRSKQSYRNRISLNETRPAHLFCICEATGFYSKCNCHNPTNSGHRGYEFIPSEVDNHQRSQ
ncbi:hypothetical protein M8C21_008214 [Ambrosia artemisiifolia]|uniref:Uncharacterized protein n=1 Tax=Ambrosia artemisiifolia TaxID=4212 RepID=A0AAD5CYR4_AMBAR|nr:hypothetical protein M8C21_008214 [Ambrosia artemisiifolia]